MGLQGNRAGEGHPFGGSDAYFSSVNIVIATGFGAVNSADPHFRQSTVNDRQVEALAVVGILVDGTDGVFVAIGLIPQNEAFASLVDLDERGYADADEQCKTRTNGIFVAGDCRKKQIRQVATAAADGAIAALAACDFVDTTK